MALSKWRAQLLHSLKRAWNRPTLAPRGPASHDRQVWLGTIWYELEVRAVVTDHDVARRILEAIPLTARGPPIIDAAVVSEAALA